MYGGKGTKECKLWYINLFSLNMWRWFEANEPDWTGVDGWKEVWLEFQAQNYIAIVAIVKTYEKNDERSRKEKLSYSKGRITWNVNDKTKAEAGSRIWRKQRNEEWRGPLFLLHSPPPQSLFFSSFPYVFPSLFSSLSPACLHACCFSLPATRLA